MAEDIQGLLNKIQTEGIAKAEAEQNKILADAKSQAEKIIADAKAEAETIRKNAEADAAVSEKKGKAAVQQAARDILIALRADLQTRMQNLVRECTGSAMTPELMGKIILETAKIYLQKNPSGEVPLEILISQKDAAALEAGLKAGLLAGLKANPEIKVSSIGAGLQVGFKGQDVFFDFSDDALTEILCGYIGPKLAAAVKG